MKKVCILGVGSTKYGRHDVSSRELALMASKEAIESAEIEPTMIQGAFISNVFSFSEKQGHMGPMVMSGLGIPHVPATTLEAACASGASAMREAYVNILASIYDLMLVVGTERVTHLDTITSTTYFTYGSDTLFEGLCGASFPGLYATMARAHMTKYGTTEEHLAMVAVKNHKNGSLNPKAHFRKEITIHDVLKSPVVASPLKLFDSCPFSDGAAAIVLCSEDFAKKYTDSPVYIAASGRAGGTGALHQREEITSLTSARLAAKQAFEQSSLSPKDIDFAEVHDCFTIAELVAMEDLGFAEKGKAARMVEDGCTSLSGELPINASGGLKSKGHPIGATGVGQAVEIWEQLMGRSGTRQIKDARIGLAHNVGATGGSCAVTIFRRD